MHHTPNHHPQRSQLTPAAPWAMPKVPAAAHVMNPRRATPKAPTHVAQPVTAQVTDQLIARALHLAFGRSFQGVPQLTPARVQFLNAAVLGAAACKNSVVVAQHFNARLVAYGRHLLPRDHWRVAAADYTAGTVLWQHHDPRLPDVLDILATGVRHGLAGTEQLRTANPGRVTRTCDLSSPRDSVLQYPGETRTYPWATIDDPLRYGIDALIALGAGPALGVSA